MNSKKYLVVAIFLMFSLFLFSSTFPAHSTPTYVPQPGDYFFYHEVISIANGTGNYVGYIEQDIYDGNETINGVSQDGIVSASYGYTLTWSNSENEIGNNSESGNFTFSSADFLYVNGTDDQTGYVNPTVWFWIDNSIPVDGNFTLLNTEMTVQSTNYSYFNEQQLRSVNATYAQGSSSYQRNDEYGQFTASYTWNAYFDPSTGYIIGYDYVEHDTNQSGDGFTYTDHLDVLSTSYPLTTVATITPNSTSSTAEVSSVDLISYVGIFAAILVLIIVIVVVVVIIYASTRKRKPLPQHSYQQYQRPPPPPPPDIDLTPKQQPPVQQIVIKEVVKVKCRYCGALIDSTAETCPICGAPRT